MPRNVFNSVQGNHPGLNHFDLSYTNTMSMKFGILYPVQCDMVTAGDYWKLKCYVHSELMPLVAPVMSDILMYVHCFFVPFRLLYGVDVSDGKSIWEKFITGGQDGDYDTPLTPWTPSFSKTTFSSETIWDCIGNPVSHTRSGSGTEADPYVYTWSPIVPYGIDVMAAPKLAYNFIWNNYYRSEDYNNEVDLWTNEDLLFVNFKKDYFTSAAWQQQRGTAPALPVDINGSSTVNFVSTFDVSSQAATEASGLLLNGDAMWLGLNLDTSDNTKVKLNNMRPNRPSNGYISGSVDGNDFSAATFTVSDMRLAFAIQRLMELSMLGGYRYTEYLHSHYGVAPTDARLDRPEYIGGFVTNVTVSPVVQTSSTSSEPTDIGTKAANGKIDTINNIGNYRVLEHGLIMTLCNIIPKPIYSQGINRQWLYQDRFSYYIPELANLSEQGIYNCELYADGMTPEDAGYVVGTTKLDNDIFGYQAAWNEMRCKNSIISGSVRDQFDYWTLARKFNSRPALNEDFLKVVHSDFNRIFAVQDEDPFIVSFSSLIDAYRPIPAYGTPGLIDHVYGGR